MFSTTTIGAAIGAVTSDVVTTGGAATTLVLGVATSLLILGFFWSRITRRAVGAKKF